MSICWDKTPWNLYLDSKEVKLWPNLLANMPFLKVSLSQYAQIHFFHITLHYMQEVPGMLPLKTKYPNRLSKEWQPTDTVLTVCCVSSVCSFAWYFMYFTFSYSRDQFSNGTVTVLQVGLLGRGCWKTLNTTSPINLNMQLLRMCFYSHTRIKRNRILVLTT